MVTEKRNNRYQRCGAGEANGHANAVHRHNHSVDTLRIFLGLNVGAVKVKREQQKCYSAEKMREYVNGLVVEVAQAADRLPR